MRKTGKLEKIVAGIGLGFAALLSSQSVNAQTVKIKTELPQSQLVADGITEYQMNVTVDTTEFPVAQIAGLEWDVVVPPYITITDAQLPSPNNPSTNPEDFFFGYFMDPAWNRVDSTVAGNELGDNVRLVDNVHEGPSNRIGELGNYFFIVNVDAPLGQSSFNLNEAELVDTAFNVYRSSDLGGNNVSFQNDVFTIIAPIPPPSVTVSTLLREKDSGLPVSEIKADGTVYEIVIGANAPDDGNMYTGGQWTLNGLENLIVTDAYPPYINDDLWQIPTTDNLGIPFIGEPIANSDRTSVNGGANDGNQVEIKEIKARADVSWGSGATLGLDNFVLDNMEDETATVNIDSFATYTINPPSFEYLIKTQSALNQMPLGGSYIATVSLDDSQFIPGGQRINQLHLTVKAPQGIQITGCETATGENDIFYNYALFNDNAKPNKAGTECVIIREVADSSQGPLPYDNNREIAKIKFSPYTTGPKRFSISDINIRDTGTNDYLQGAGVSQDNSVFFVVKQQQVPSLDY